jgi:hypothetical protein
MQYRLDNSKHRKQYYMKICQFCNEIFLCKGICNNEETIFREQICNCPEHSTEEESKRCQKLSWKFNPSCREEYQTQEVKFKKV